MIQIKINENKFEVIKEIMVEYNEIQLIMVEIKIAKLCKDMNELLCKIIKTDETLRGIL